ncbi:MAG: hypothetical protein SGBAC_009602 [Bacillariaceae sp.]
MPVTAPSILKRVPSKQQSPSYKAASKQKSSRFSAPTVRKPAFKSREGETEEDVKRRRMWHTTGTFIDGVECMYVHNYHVPVSEKHVAEPYSGKGKGKGGSSEYYSGKGKGKGGSSGYYYSSKGKGKGGSGSGSSKSSGSKRRNLSSAYGGYENGWRNNRDGGKSIREPEDTDDEWRSEVEEEEDDDDWRNDDDNKKSQKDMTSNNAKSQRKMRRYVPNHYYPPSDYTYYTPYGNGEPYHGAGGYHDRYSASFILVDDGFFSEAPSEAPSSQLNAIAQTRGIPFIGEHPDDVDQGNRTVEIGEINMQHIGSGKPPVPGPTLSQTPSQEPSSVPSVSDPPSTEPTESPTQVVDDEGNRFIGIKFEGRN